MNRTYDKKLRNALQCKQNEQKTFILRIENKVRIASKTRTVI